MIICTFCLEDKNPSEEHIIPENIGGSVIIKRVCKDCNSILGTEVDSELNRERRIYDAYRELKARKGVNLDLAFRFMDSYYLDERGNKIRVSKSSKDSRVLPTRIGPNTFVKDHSDKNFIKKLIKSKTMKQGIDKGVTEKKISDYSDFIKRCKPGDIYEDKDLGIVIKTEKKDRVRKTIMNRKTPHRFLAKACVEFAYLLGIEREIKNLDTLRCHALYGNKLEEIRCFEELITDDDAAPIHLIQFTPEQFHIHFFLKYATAIEIAWEDKPLEIFLGNDLITKDLRILLPDKENKRLEMTNLIFNLHEIGE